MVLLCDVKSWRIRNCMKHEPGLRLCKKPSLFNVLWSESHISNEIMTEGKLTNESYLQYRQRVAKATFTHTDKEGTHFLACKQILCSPMIKIKPNSWHYNMYSAYFNRWDWDCKFVLKVEMDGGDLAENTVSHYVINKYHLKGTLGNWHDW